MDALPVGRFALDLGIDASNLVASDIYTSGVKTSQYEIPKTRDYPL